MKILNTKFNGLKIIEGIKFDDSRGYFREIFLEKLFKKNKFIFWCMSNSKKNVVRGIRRLAGTRVNTCKWLQME